MCVTLPVFVNELTCEDKFFVTQDSMQDAPLILGRGWQRKYNCFFNWERALVHCQSADKKLWIPLQKPIQASTNAKLEETTTLEAKPISAKPQGIKQKLPNTRRSHPNRYQTMCQRSLPHGFQRHCCKLKGKYASLDSQGE